MFKKIISLLLCVSLVITMGLCLCSCKKANSKEFPVNVGSITIEEEPMNIVVLSDCLADIVSYTDYSGKIIGVGDDCTQDYLAVVPSMGTASTPDVDKIIKNGADLVITEVAVPDDAKKKLDEAEIQVLTLSRAKNFKELQTLYTNICTALGGNISGKAEGAKAYTELIDTLKSYGEAVSSDIITTACYLYLDESGALCTFTNNTIEHEIFSYCGAINVFSEQQTPQIDTEQLRVSTPSFIFYDNPDVLDVLLMDAELSNMSAVVNENYLEVKKIDFSRQGVTYEDLIFTMMDFMFNREDEPSTPDQATVDEITPEAETTAPTDTATEETELY